MNTNIIINCVFIAGFALLAFAPFSRKRIRARWANSTFAICAVVGVAKGLVGLAWHSGWLVLGSEASRRVDAFLYMAGGLLLGFIFSLIFSGQLGGSKRTNEGVSKVSVA